MTTTLITGKGGTPHITSGDMGAMQAGVIGNGSYLLQGSDGTFPTVTMQDANHALIPVLNLVVEGRYARVTEAETATIESGMSGQNRNDLVCLKYTRNSQNIETAAIAVLKGTPNTGTAADPTVPSGSIHSASDTAWIPIARIPISGITPGTPVMLIKQLPPMSKLWDSVTLTKPNDNWDVDYRTAFVGGMLIDRRVSCHSSQHGLDCPEDMGYVQAFQASDWIGGRVRGALRHGVQFERGASWRRGADRWQRDQPSLGREDDARQRRLGRGLHHGTA